MSRCHAPWTALLSAALLVVGMPAAVRGQAAIADAAPRRPAVSMSGGAFAYDLSGTGTVPMLAVRAELPLTRFTLVEGGLTAARPDQQFGARTTFLAPEAQLQLQLPLAGGRVAPYLGAGAGAALDFRGRQFGGTQADLTASAAGGLRAWLTEQVGLRAEMRVRGIGRGFTGSAAEWTLGAAWRP
jgi:hypothetical protein